MEEYQLIEDQNSLLGERTPLNARYTELLMIRKHRPQKQREHELTATGRRHMEVLEKSASNYSSTDIASLFEPDQSGETPRTVVLQGPAGIGKTMTVQKIMLGWATGELYQEAFDYVFCIHCRELSLAEANSLANLILEQCQDIDAPVNEILAYPEKLLFIIDGFDELRFSLEPETNQPCDSPYSKVPLESLLSNLMRKKLLPKSHLLITTRPGAAEKLQGFLKFPRFTEILGFSEKGRREYFFKFFADDRKANLALRFIENSTAVSTICFIPMVCWIICSVIEVELEMENEIADTLDTTTKVFVQFTHSLLNQVSSKLKFPLDEIRKLCALAQAGLLEQKILFEEEDLKEHHLDGSHLKDLILERRTFRKGPGCHSLYSFLHLCFQEFFAAMLYILQEDPTGDPHDYEGDLKRLLVACEKPGNEHLTLTVRFIFGLSGAKVRVFLEQTLQCRTSDLVKPLLLQRAEEVVTEDPPRTGYRLLTFFHCLFESQEVAFAKRVMHHFPTIDLSFKTISVLDCRVLAFCLQHSPVQDHSIDLTFCRLKSHHIKALAPGIKNCATLK